MIPSNDTQQVSDNTHKVGRLRDFLNGNGASKYVTWRQFVTLMIIPILAPILTFTLLFGNMQGTVKAQGEEIKEHKEQPTHPDARERLASIETNIEIIKEMLEKELKDEKPSKEDTRESD